MIMYHPLLAELGSIEKIVITILAVGGGFLIGSVLTNLLTRGVFKFGLHKQSPDKLVRVLRVGGGAGAAFLVYMLLGGEGGFGLGGKGGGDANPNQGERETAERKEKKDSRILPIMKAPENESNDEQVVVEVYKSNSMDKKFYRYSKDSTAISLEEVLRRIDDSFKAGKKPVKLVRIRAGETDYPVQAASALEAELRQRRIEYTSPPSGPTKTGMN